METGRIRQRERASNSIR